MSDKLCDPNIQKQLCAYSFDILQQAFKLNVNPTFPKELENESFPLFVTYTIGKEKTLRGCVGTFASNNLKKNLESYSLIAAFEDHRFRPMSQKELPNLNVGISLLTDFEPVNNIYDWEIGKHGIQIDFNKGGQSYRGTYLPEVAKEQEWDQKTALSYLIQKAGYYGDLEEVEKDIKLTRYQSKKFFMSYNDYLEYKKQ